MKIADDRSFGSMYVRDIVVMSGVRPAGRNTDFSHTGRPHHGFLYIWSGEARFFEKGKRAVAAKEGELLYLPKGQKYKMQYTEPNTTFVLVNLEMIGEDGEDLFLFDRITVAGRDDRGKRIAGVMTKFEMSSVSQSPAAVLRRKELAYRLLSMVYEEGSPLFTEQQRYPQIFEGALLLKQSYLENIPITALAAACNVSVSSFRSLFHKQYGMSPVQYRNRLRIIRARELLGEGSCTVAEACFASGFENIGYFCRCYKKITGEAPGQTKKQNSDD